MKVKQLLHKLVSQAEKKLLKGKRQTQTIINGHVLQPRFAVVNKTHYEEQLQYTISQYDTLVLKLLDINSDWVVATDLVRSSVQLESKLIGRSKWIGNIFGDGVAQIGLALDHFFIDTIANQIIVLQTTSKELRSLLVLAAPQEKDIIRIFELIISCHSSTSYMATEATELTNEIAELYVRYCATKGTIMHQDEMQDLLELYLKRTRQIQQAFMALASFVNACLQEPTGKETTCIQTTNFTLLVATTCVKALTESINICASNAPLVLSQRQSPARENLEIQEHAQAEVIFSSNELVFQVRNDAKNLVSLRYWFDYVPLSNSNMPSSYPFEKITAVNCHVKISEFLLTRGLCWNPNDDCLYVCAYYEIMRVSLQGNKKLEFRGQFNNVAVLSRKDVFCCSGSEDIEIADRTGNIVSYFPCTYPYGVAVDDLNENIFVADKIHNTILAINLQKGDITTLAGSSQSSYADGQGQLAHFSKPRGICFDETNQSILVCDWGNNLIRRVSLDGYVSTVCRMKEPEAIATVNNITFAVSEKYLFKIVKQGGTYSATRILGFEGEELRGIVIHEPSQSCFVTDKCSVLQISFA